MSSEITDAVQIIHILFEGTDLFLRVAGVGMKPLKQLTKLIMGILAKEKMEGKTSMKNLLKRGGDMHVFKFPQEQLKKVEAMAKKYGILYSLLPDFNKDGMREIVFHAESLPRMNALIEKLKAVTELAGGSNVVTGDYPGWRFRKDSPLREKMVRLYREIYGKEPKVEAIHAGLECGILGSKIADLDCVSIGPDMQDIHTTEETLSISSTKSVWEYLVCLLETKDQG